MARKRFSSRDREKLWDYERMRAWQAGRSDSTFCICNLCDNPVLATDDWDESHDPAMAKSFGGKKVGVAHRRCNREHGAKVVTPAVAKSDRIRRFHIGASGPGRGKYPMPAGRRSNLTKTIRGKVQPRKTLAEKLAETRTRRAILPPPPQD